MRVEYTVTVHEPARAALFTRLFGSATVGVCSRFPSAVTVPELGAVLAYRLNLALIGPAARARLVDHLAARFGHDAEFVDRQLDAMGVPIIAEGCTVSRIEGWKVAGSPDGGHPGREVLSGGTL
ncbi:MAG: hypothetical protein M5U01_09440 [Ardenticatenaceae bacterium]|nr:hypothetical protein [Ardenticatenaceae bacterium]